MKKIIILLVICVLSYSTNGQGFCITPSPSYQPLGSFSDDLLNNDPIFSAVFQSPSPNTAFTFKIYLHVIRKSDGTGGQSVSAVNEAVNYLHNDFAPHNIYFRWDKTIDYIDSDTFYNPTSNQTSPSYALKIFSINPHQDGIDIYLFDDDSGLNAGRANFWGSNRSPQLFVSGKSTNSYTKSHVVSHEMGHLFQLYHTHETYFAQEYISGSWVTVATELELVNGSNAARRGDLVVDTPADPGLRTQDPITKIRTINVDLNTCLWTKSGTVDVNGDAYAPDTKNIMAYTQPECMEYFTLEQGKRMRDATQVIPYLQNALVEVSQNNSIAIGTTTPTSSAIIDINSLTQGVLFPRLTKTEIGNIKTPVEGLVVYCTTASKKGLFVHNGTNFTHWKTSEIINTLSTATIPTNSSKVSFGYTSTSSFSSIVTFNSLTKGVVLPRLTKAEIGNIKTPAEGLVVYCKDCTTKGLLVNNSSSFTNESETVSTSSSATSLNNTPRYGIGTTMPNISALLEIKSTKQGVLFPRLSKTLMNAIAKPVEGLIAYCTDCTPKGLYVYNGATFVSTK